MGSKRATALCAAMNGIGGGLGWAIVPPLLPMIAKQMSLSPTATGVVWGAAPLGIAIAAPFGGAAVDRFGVRRVAGLAMLFGAAACASRAMAGGVVGLVLAMFAFGAHIGFVAPAIPKALAAEVPAARLARANGIALLAYTLTTALTVFTARTWIVPFLGGWRPAMIAAGAAMAVAGCLWLLLARDRAGAPRHAGVRDVLKLASNPSLRAIGAMQFLLFGGYLALLGMLPAALGAAGIAPAKIGAAIAAWLVVAAAANLGGPWLSDRIGRRRPVILAGSLVAGTALMAMAIVPPSGAMALLALAAVGGGAFAPILLTLPIELRDIGPARAGAALGLLMLLGQVGGFLLPVAGGALATRYGFGAAIGFLGLLHLAIVAPCLAVAETGRAAREADPLAFPAVA